MPEKCTYTNPFTGLETKIYVPHEYRCYVWNQQISFERYCIDQYFTPFEIENKLPKTCWKVIEKWRKSLRIEARKFDNLQRVRSKHLAAKSRP